MFLAMYIFHNIQYIPAVMSRLKTVEKNTEMNVIVQRGVIRGLQFGNASDSIAKGVIAPLVLIHLRQFSTFGDFLVL